MPTVATMSSNCSAEYTAESASQVGSDIDDVECNSSAATSNDLSRASPSHRPPVPPSTAFDLGIGQAALTCDQHVLAPLVPALAVPTGPQDQQLAVPCRQRRLRQDVGGEHQPPAEQIGMVGERGEDVEHLAIGPAQPRANSSARRGSSVSRRTGSRGGGVLIQPSSHEHGPPGRGVAGEKIGARDRTGIIIPIVAIVVDRRGRLIVFKRYLNSIKPDTESSSAVRSTPHRGRAPPAPQLHRGGSCTRWRMTRSRGSTTCSSGRPGSWRSRHRCRRMPPPSTERPSAETIARGAIARGGLDDVLRRCAMESTGHVTVHWGRADDADAVVVEIAHGSIAVSGHRIDDWFESLRDHRPVAGADRPRLADRPSPASAAQTRSESAEQVAGRRRG